MKYSIQLQSTQSYDTDFFSVGDIDDLLTDIHKSDIAMGDDWGRIDGSDDHVLEYFEAANISQNALNFLLVAAAQYKLVVLCFHTMEL